MAAAAAATATAMGAEADLGEAADRGIATAAGGGRGTISTTPAGKEWLVAGTALLGVFTTTAGGSETTAQQLLVRRVGVVVVVDDDGGGSVVLLAGKGSPWGAT